MKSLDKLGDPLVPRRRQRGVEQEDGGKTTLENGDRMRLVGIQGSRMGVEREADQSSRQLTTGDTPSLPTEAKG